MKKIKLKSVFFKKLKGLNNVNIEFSDTLTAIMGVNGSGKTTVIHALACVYQPDANGENHRFPEFFVPNTDSLWQGSEFHVVNTIENSKGKKMILPSRKYSKDSDRWSPRYSNRPKKNIYYVGIDTCLPAIEKETTKNRIIYKSSQLTDKIYSKVAKISAYILNKDYNCLIDNSYRNKHFIGVKMHSGLKYSSLSMGSGEQRVIKIIDVMLKAEAYSLVLIDEIDLLLHVSALRKLIEMVHDIAQKKHIQVVFTTHSLEMINLSEYVKIQYISNSEENNTSLIYEKITSDSVYNMTGQLQKTHTVFVEDILAKNIVCEIVRKNGMSSSIDVVTYGAIENAFTLAASFVIQDDELQNKLIVLDGDRYRSKEGKESQLKKKLSGTEEDVEMKRNNALNIITEFVLPTDYSPEKFLFDTILRCFPKDDEIYIAANEIKAVHDSHEWIKSICYKLSIDYSNIVYNIFNYTKEDVLFNNYIAPIKQWVILHKNI